jgi:hypothetical protein
MVGEQIKIVLFDRKEGVSEVGEGTAVARSNIS